MSEASPRIAVVDDEESVRKALGRLLRSTGMEAKTFPSGPELLDAIPVYHPDCVVLDLHMPRVNGFEVLARMAALPMPVPVIVITGHDVPGARARVLAGGAAAYLLKPVDEYVLLEAIAAAVAANTRIRCPLP